MTAFRRLLSVLILTILMAVGMACQGTAEVNNGTDCTHGSGTLKTEARTLSTFQSLEVDGAFSVIVTCQKEQAVTVSADDNLLPLIITEVNEGTLRITTRKPVCTSQPITVTITVEALDRINSGGANNFTVSALNSPSLKVKLSGAGNMSVTGQTTTLSTTLEGASEIHARELQADQVYISISGAGSAEVYASDALHVDISGVGDVSYDGQPGKVVRNITGWGTVAPLNK